MKISYSFLSVSTWSQQMEKWQGRRRPGQPFPDTCPGLCEGRTHFSPPAATVLPPDLLQPRGPTYPPTKYCFKYLLDCTDWVLSVPVKNIWFISFGSAGTFGHVLGENPELPAEQCWPCHAQGRDKDRWEQRKKGTMLSDLSFSILPKQSIPGEDLNLRCWKQNKCKTRENWTRLQLVFLHHLAPCDV